MEPGFLPPTSCAVLPRTSLLPGLHSFSSRSPGLSPPFPSQGSSARVCSVDYSVGASLFPTHIRHLAYPSVRVAMPLGLGHPAHRNGKCLSLPSCPQLGGGWGGEGAFPISQWAMYTYTPSLRGSPRSPMMAFTHPTTILMPKETQK